MFGGSKQKPPSTQDAIQKLRETEEMLLKKSEYLKKKIDMEMATAKKAGTKNKRVALTALKRKKRYEKNLQQIDGTLSTIEFQREALENASTNTEVLKVMGFATKALEGVHGKLEPNSTDDEDSELSDEEKSNSDVDQVHKLMDDVAEQREISIETSETMSNPIGYNQDVDEDDLLNELEEMEQEELDRQMLGVGEETEDLPSVPTSEPSERAPAKAAKEEDDDMKELEMWAS